MAKTSCVRCNKLIQFRMDGPADGEGDNVRVLLDGCGCCATGRLIEGQHYCLKCAHLRTVDELERDMGKFAIIDGKIAPNPDIERLAKIDSREVYGRITEDTFTDDDTWLAREMSWLAWVESMEKPRGKRRKGG